MKKTEVIADLVDMRKRLKEKVPQDIKGRAALLTSFKKSINQLSRYKVTKSVGLLIYKERIDDFNKFLESINMKGMV